MPYANLIDWTGIQENKKFEAGMAYTPISEKRTAQLLSGDNPAGRQLIRWVDKEMPDTAKTANEPEETTDEVIEVPEDSKEEIDFESMKIDDLKAYLDGQGIAYDSTDKKADLIAKAKA
ncbi:MAG: HeH/LEM domain-containing protein [Aerococcus sanguinicola]